MLFQNFAWLAKIFSEEDEELSSREFIFSIKAENKIDEEDDQESYCRGGGA